MNAPIAKRGNGWYMAPLTDRETFLESNVSNVDLTHMRIYDKRLDRQLDEQLFDHDVITGVTDADMETEPNELNWIMNQYDDMIATFDENLYTRRAIMIAPDATECIVGIQVVVRDKLYVIAWLRSSDVLKRPHDIELLKHVGLIAERDIGVNRGVEVHIFTTSLHEELS